MNQYDRASKIAEFLKSKVSTVPDTAIVLGSGLGTVVTAVDIQTEIPYSDIKYFPVPTVEGHFGRMLFGKMRGKSVIIMQGRFHPYEGYGMDEVTLYVRVFQLLGVKTLIVTNAAGAINRDFVPGDLMLITDHIGYFCESPLYGANDERFGTRFPSMTEAYSGELISLAQSVSDEKGLNVKRGVYCYAKGPMYETPAEIRAAAALGADACGMSTVPEVIVAVHGGIRVLGISCLTNMAAGITGKPLNHEEVVLQSRASAENFKTLLCGICEKL